jgi:hypothetical protein
MASIMEAMRPIYFLCEVDDTVTFPATVGASAPTVAGFWEVIEAAMDSGFSLLHGVRNVPGLDGCADPDARIALCRTATEELSAMTDREYWQRYDPKVANDRSLPDWPAPCAYHELPINPKDLPKEYIQYAVDMALDKMYWRPRMRGEDVPLSEDWEGPQSKELHKSTRKA